MEPLIPLFAAALLAGIFLYLRKIAHVVVYDFQKGLMYKHGTFVKIVGAGRYSFLKSRTDIQVVDTRRMMLALGGQEILTKDNISLKMSLAGFYEVTDPVKAKHGSQNYINELYNLAQIALREAAAAYGIDELLEKKGRARRTTAGPHQGQSGRAGRDVFGTCRTRHHAPRQPEKSIFGHHRSKEGSANPA